MQGVVTENYSRHNRGTCGSTDVSQKSVRVMREKQHDRRWTGKGVLAFVPSPLPPIIEYDPDLIELLSEADRSLGLLAGTGQQLPNPHLLIAPHLRREAVLSSRIEGTVASVSDLYYYEAVPSAPPRSPDVLEVASYVRALEFGLKRLDELPLSLRLVRELHALLMQEVRGDYATAGEFRDRQNWIGSPGSPAEEARFMPPPVEEMRVALGQWEAYLHNRGSAPLLVQCALQHYQFEAIHPFIDGNGRLGRLLITLFLCERGGLPLPLLYLSAYFERHKDQYLDRLYEVSTTGNWNGWLKFFFEAVRVQSMDAVESAGRLLSLQQAYRERLSGKRVSGRVFTLLDSLLVNPFITVPEASNKLGVQFSTAQAALTKLEEVDIISEITGRSRNRIYCAEELLKAIEEPRYERNASPYPQQLPLESRS